VHKSGSSLSTSKARVAKITLVTDSSPARSGWGSTLTGGYARSRAGHPAVAVWSGCFRRSSIRLPVPCKLGRDVAHHACDSTHRMLT
jgi:hypothetical protein